jgi:uncharacterized protein with NAD-binding domain and iron-sulfur cluster
VPSHILVAGGGVAGLAAATLLAEHGHRVTLCERAPRLGGRAKSDRTPEGAPSEHSLRIITLYHQHLLELMARVDDGRGGTLLDHLVAVKKVSVFADGPALPPEGPRAIGRPWSPTKRAIGRLVRPMKIAATTALRFVGFTLAFRKRGIPTGELIGYLHKHIRAVWMCEARQRAELDGISYADYLDFDRKSDAFQRYFSRLPRIAVAARMGASARHIVTMMLRLIFDLQTPPPGYEHYSTLMMLDGPSNERLIEPWADWLRARGVEIVLGNGLADVRCEGAAIRAVTLDDGRELAVDGVVAALPVLGLRRLAATTVLGRLDPRLLDQPWLQLEWSNGLQIFLRDLPPGAAAQFAPGVPALHLDSPWGFVHVVQGDGFWRDVPMPPGTRYVLSATWSSAHDPGAITHKPVTRCTHDEILAECLAQIGFPAGDHVIGWQLDHELAWVDEAAYPQAAPEPHVAGEPHDGRRLVNHAPLVFQLPDAEGAALEATTAVENLYLAGDFVATRFFWSSMEKAAEAGFNAARAVIGRTDPAAARAAAILAEPIPFGILRSIDAWWYGARQPKATRGG